LSTFLNQLCIQRSDFGAGKPAHNVKFLAHGSKTAQRCRPYDFPMIEAIGILYLIVFGLLIWFAAPIGIALTFAALAICMFAAGQWARNSLTI
jgi:hypothetical protein